MWGFRKGLPPPPPPEKPVAQQATPASSFQLALLNRAHQQAAVSALGQYALSGVDMEVLLDHAATFIAQTLSLEFSAVHRLDDAGATLRLIAACGISSKWMQSNSPASLGSMGRYVLDSAEPVIVRDLKTITQFEVPPIWRELNVASGMSVNIACGGSPWGILQAHTTRIRKFGEDDFHFLQSIANIIGAAHQRREAEAENAKLAAFPQQNPNPVLEFDATGALTYFNAATQNLITLLRRQDAIELLPPSAHELVSQCFASGASVLDVQVEITGRTLSWSFFPIPTVARVHAYAVDVTERLNLEAQLRQSQKMEAIGQLAAGVAHDFNNILTIMQGLIRKLEREHADPAETRQQLYDTTERAAALTRQLLAFSRRQVIQPRVLDVREVVSGISRMLQRLIGEDIVLSVQNPPTLSAIEADPSMLEQILLNLAVNARDAMPRGGQLVITTDQVTLPDPMISQRTFVRVRVQDTGCGMTAEIKARIFEPFFTTKEVGKGTGLGLATVFGIVKQHSGFIEVESELGRGTTFCILLPACDRQPECAIAAPSNTSSAPATPSGGTETILLVEDEPLLRELAQVVLTSVGYKVLEAGQCEEAFAIWQEYEGNIDLLVTDMVLPGGMNGRDLAAHLQRVKPDLKVIYTTGYSPDAIEAEITATNFLQKPYPPEVLTRTVRACLDARMA